MNILRIDRITALILLALLIFSPSHFALASPGHSGGHGEEVGGGTAEFPIVFIVKALSANELNQTLESSGEVLVKNESGVYALQSGIVESLLVDIGDEVNKGEIIGYLRAGTAETALAAELIVQQAELEAANKQLANVGLTTVPQTNQLTDQRDALSTELGLQEVIQAGEAKQLQNDIDSITARINASNQNFDANLANIDAQISANETAVAASATQTSGALFEVSSAVASVLYKSVSNTTYNNLRSFSDSQLSQNTHRDYETFYNNISSVDASNNLITNTEDALALVANARILADLLIPGPTNGGDEGIKSIKIEVDEASDHLTDISASIIDIERETESLIAEKELLLNNRDQEIIELELELLSLQTEQANLSSNQILDLSYLQTELKNIEHQIQILQGQNEQQRSNTEQLVNIRGAQLQATRSQIGASRAIVAPFDGVITKRHVNVGEAVSLSTPVFDLLDDGEKFIRFFVPESDIHFVKQGVEVTYSPVSMPELSFPATIQRISRTIDVETRTVLVEADLPEDVDDTILAHMNVRVNIPVNNNEETLVIPTDAIDVSESSDHVWIVNSDVKAEQRTIEIDFIHGEYVYLESGLDINNYVITRSPIKLEDELDVQTEF